MKIPRIGAKVKVILNRSSHGFPMGTEVTVIANTDVANRRITAKNANNQQYCLYYDEYEQKADLESFKNEMATLEKELFQVKKCVEYLELTGKTEANVNEVNAYYVLQLVADKKMSDVDKSVEIARLLS